VCERHTQTMSVYLEVRACKRARERVCERDTQTTNLHGTDNKCLFWPLVCCKRDEESLSESKCVCESVCVKENHTESL